MYSTIILFKKLIVVTYKTGRQIYWVSKTKGEQNIYSCVNRIDTPIIEAKQRRTPLELRVLAAPRSVAVDETI